MRKVKKWRYYCEHCNKSGASGGHMAAHEKSCCRNPLRECRMCKLMALVQEPIEVLTAALERGGMKDLRAASGQGEWDIGCPACNLAAIIQLRRRLNEEKSADNYEGDFDFRADVRQVFDQLAKTDREDAGY